MMTTNNDKTELGIYIYISLSAYVNADTADFCPLKMQTRIFTADTLKL